MKKYLVIGNPIDHSLSPKLQNFWIKNNNIHAHYDKKKVNESDIKILVENIKSKKLAGINVTVPFKKAVIPYLDKLSQEAEHTQSVNTIYLENNNLIGHNTDIEGFNRAIKSLNFNITFSLTQFEEPNVKDFIKNKEIKNFYIDIPKNSLPPGKKYSNKLMLDNALDQFLKDKLNLFGDYEDAVSKKSNILFHSALSPIINLGLITPSEILEKIKKIEKKVRINSLEGYVRQIIGWREFMRGIYQNYDKHLENTNFFNHKNKMKISWYNGTTGLDPLDHSIKNALNYGWSHHIERLMILANIMNLCQIHPNQVYKWFMEMFVDSSDWVMAPNVYGMGLFSDGGIFATKPYICGSSYFLKMMDFKKGEWCNIMDGLYWNFINKNRKFFLKNPRLSMMVRVFDKIKNERKKIILKAAEKFIKQNTI